MLYWLVNVILRTSTTWQQYQCLTDADTNPSVDDNLDFTG